MAEISDEAVRAALDAFWWEPADAESTMRAALTAALPFLEANQRAEASERRLADAEAERDMLMAAHRTGRYEPMVAAYETVRNAIEDRARSILEDKANG